MSKWINKELFSKFQEEKKNEQEKQQAGPRRVDIVWPTPEKGTEQKPKVYKGRLLPSPDGTFYHKYYYHMFQSGEKWQFVLCNKTFNFDSFCPFCSATSKLYMGNTNDKKQATSLKRKEKFVTNWYVVEDPRDAEREEKMEKTVKIYEFPSKVESKFKAEMTDKEGLGLAIFDPEKTGFDFIIKVGATKTDANGKSYPDYSNSQFSRRASALGKDEDIEKIMSCRHNISEYINSMKRSDEDIKKILEAEMIYDLIADEWEKQNGVSKTKEVETDLPFSTDEEDEEKSETVDAVGVSDEDLLKELDSL